MKKMRISRVSQHTENTVRKHYSFCDDGNGIHHEIVREIYILKKIQSPYVISLLNIDPEFKYIELPMYSIDLCDFINKNVLNTEQIRNIFFQICSGIYALHSAQIIHRDIKPENICLSHDSYQDDIRVVLIDAGHGRKVNGKMTPKAGTVCYQAPEMLAGAKYSYGIDVWGAGCVLGTLYLRKLAFPKGLSEIELLDMQVKLCGTPSVEKIGEKYNIPEHLKFLKYLPIRSGKLGKYFKQYGEDLYNLISKMLHIDYRQRFTITQCLNSDYLGNHKFPEPSYLDKNYLDKSYLIKVKPEWRKLLIEEVCSKKPEVYSTAVRILDEYTFKNSEITEKNYQLVGMASMLLASKLESMTFFNAEKLAGSDVKDLLEMEKNILRDCEFN